MHHGIRNDSVDPSSSLNRNCLPDRSPDLSYVVLPSSIARQPRPPYTRISIHTLTPESTPPPQEQSSPTTRPDVYSLAGLPRAILPEPARTEIAIPRAYSTTCTRRPILQIPSSVPAVVGLIISVILAFRSAVPIVAVGTESNMTATSTGPWTSRARRCLVRTTAKQIQHEKHVEMRDRDLENQPPPASAGASRRSSSSQSRVPSRYMSKTPLFLPPPSESTSSEPCQCDRDGDHDPLDTISINPSSSSSRLAPPRRSPRKTKKWRG
ncbi:hypothetical protein EDB86DRAFT_3123171 [Lactarius hatsudake]|nr:hypothetical protein EDB86DRAFT_3123171 [Lactarius hatsudake]